MFTDFSSTLAAAALLAAAITWTRPAWGLSLLLASLPFFTHHPASSRTRWLVALTAAVQLIYLLRVQPSPRRVWRRIADHPLLLLGALFVAAAFLSLSSLPLWGLWREYRAAFAVPDLTGWPRALAWFRLGEAEREFPITSALLTAQGFVLALLVYRETAIARSAAHRLAAAITVGMLVFVALGVLEAFGIADLQPLRGTTLVESRPGSLQSTAGNPGWFAQYLVYALPYALVVLARPSPSRGRLMALAAITAVTALAIIVSGQRGGWVSGAVVILGMGGVAPMLIGGGIGPAARSSVWRVVAAGGVMAALVATGFSFWLSGPQTDSEFGPGAYVTRLKSIADGDRLPYLYVGGKMAVLHPVLGGGHESFAHLYQRHFAQPDGVYHATPPLAQVASAHNVFMQTLAGTGTVGLVVLVAMFVVAAVYVGRGLRSSDIDRGRLVVMLASGGSLLGVVCYGMVQEVFYVHALRLLFFVSLGLLAGVSGDLLRWPRRTGVVLWLALGATFAVHLGYEYWWPGPERLLPVGLPTGLHAEEHGAGDAPFRWSTEWATWPMPAGVTTYALRVRSLAPFAQDVVVEACDGVSVPLVLRDHGWHTVEGHVENCAAPGRLQLRVAPAWRPPGDGRLLGVMTADVRVR